MKIIHILNHIVILNLLFIICKLAVQIEEYASIHRLSSSLTYFDMLFRRCSNRSLHKRLVSKCCIHRNWALSLFKDVKFQTIISRENQIYVVQFFIRNARKSVYNGIKHDYGWLFLYISFVQGIRKACFGKNKYCKFFLYILKQWHRTFDDRKRIAVKQGRVWSE